MAPNVSVGAIGCGGRIPASYISISSLGRFSFIYGAVEDVGHIVIFSEIVVLIVAIIRNFDNDITEPIGIITLCRRPVSFIRFRGDRRYLFGRRWRR